MAETLVLKTPGTLSVPRFGTVPNLLWRFRSRSFTQADGYRISSWQSDSGSEDLELTYASALGPVIRDTSLGKAVRFASADSLRIGSGSFATPKRAPLTMYAVLTRLDIGTGLGTIWSGGAEGYLSAGMSDTSGIILAGGGTSTYEMGGPGTPTGAFVVVVVYDGARSSITVNDTTVYGSIGTADPSRAQLPRLSLGSNSGWNTSFLNAYLYEQGAFANAFTEGDIYALVQQKRNEYGF